MSNTFGLEFKDVDANHLNIQAVTKTLKAASGQGEPEGKVVK